ncbi:helix-turn-helix domain-containing protein [Pseudomonas sp. NPDC077649]|uniref:helix-turn-helix domain-containing protein n=1 Tax=Pseudomonas sp. NPDC077649 TaxID=3364423 RepID=UPI0037CA77F7
MLGERLKEERKRLGLTQPLLAEVAGAAKRTVIDWEKGVSSPTAAQLEVLAGVGMDVLYVVTGQRASTVTGQSHRSTTTVVTEMGNPVTGPGAVPLIDAERLARIVDLLEAYASQAGRRWPAKRLVAVAAEVYNVLADEPALDEPKVERILKLVVNR